MYDVRIAVVYHIPLLLDLWSLQPSLHTKGMFTMLRPTIVAFPSNNHYSLVKILHLNFYSLQDCENVQPHRNRQHCRVLRKRDAIYQSEGTAAFARLYQEDIGIGAIV